MSWLRRFLQPSNKPTEVEKDSSPSVRYAMEAMPTIKFDPSVVTKSVKADLRRNGELLAGDGKRNTSNRSTSLLCGPSWVDGTSIRSATR